MPPEPPLPGRNPSAPWLGRVIAIALLLMFVMVALGVWGVFRHAREQDRITREGGGIVPAATPAQP